MKRNLCGPFRLEDDIRLVVLEGLRKERREREDGLASPGAGCGLGALEHMVDACPQERQWCLWLRCLDAPEMSLGNELGKLDTS